MHVDDTYVELRNEGAYRRAFEADERFRVTIESDGREWTDVLASKYLKLVTRIVGSDPRLTYSVLTRTNWLSSIPIREFERRLRSCLGEDVPEEMVSVSTVHSYKGEESDVSIVLRVVDRQFPLVHPDSALLAPLGQTPKRVIEEERRLFYVAISRARARLVLVTERDRESLFLEEITGRAFSGDSKHGFQP
jgi:superfamily I DNA/RNA helicase